MERRGDLEVSPSPPEKVPGWPKRRIDFVLSSHSVAIYGRRHWNWHVWQEIRPSSLYRVAD